MTIDFWSIGLEAVNFLVLVWLLERLLYRPVLGVIGRRQAEIDQLQQADEAAQHALAAERERLEQERRTLVAERTKALEDAHAQAHAERARLELESRAEMDRLLAEGRARLEHERTDAVRALRRKSVELGVSVARRLLSMSTPPDGDSRFVEAVCQQLDDFSEPDRSRLVAGLAARAEVQVVTADALDEKHQNECRVRISNALGHTVEPTFLVDASLIAGIEIHFPDLVLRHCWRDALAEGETKLTEEAERAPLEEGDDGQNAS